jgi:DNA end-binding protein Ku
MEYRRGPACALEGLVEALARFLPYRPAVAASERISFRQVNRQTGNRLRQQLVDVVTGEPVQSHNKGRGYEAGDNQFLLVRDDEMEAAEQEARSRPYSAAPPRTAVQDDEQPEPSNVLTSARPFSAAPMKNMPSRQEEPIARRPVTPDPMSAVADTPVPAPTQIENNRTIEIDRFIPRPQVDARYLDTPYYIVPRDEVGQEAFALIRDAMRGKDVVGMGRVVLARRERPIIVEPMGNGIRGITLRCSHWRPNLRLHLCRLRSLRRAEWQSHRKVLVPNNRTRGLDKPADLR